MRLDAPLPRGIPRVLAMGLVDDAVLSRAYSMSPITSVLKKQQRKRQVVYKPAKEIGLYCSICLLLQLTHYAAGIKA